VWNCGGISLSHSDELPLLEGAHVGKVVLPSQEQRFSDSSLHVSCRRITIRVGTQPTQKTKKGTDGHTPGSQSRHH
jgi:hypothetical protein